MRKLRTVLLTLAGLGVFSTTSAQVPTISVGDVSVGEEAGRAVLNVQLSAPLSSSVTFGFGTQRASATNGADFYGTYQRLEIPAGQTSTTLTVVILNDAIQESNEQFGVLLSGLSTNARFAKQRAIVTIRDDDGPDTGADESFGQVAPPERSGPGWSAIDAYYRDFPRRPGECSQEVHDRYWVRGADGKIHPTWHPAVDPSGCSMAHEHGDDPRTSQLYQFSQRIPFGMTTTANGNDFGGAMRHEDHVGHKVVVQNDWFVVNGNPQHGDIPTTDVITRTNIQCDWLSKIHQGSHSKDALANNAHEYFLNIRCNDGLNFRLKQLVTFGPADLVTELCTNNQAFATGRQTMTPVPVYNFLDGKREFNCVSHFLNPWLPEVKARRLEELWKPDGVIQFPSGGFINFSPYYVVFNPARYMDHLWQSRNASDAFISSVNLCFDDPGENVFRDQAPRWCDQVPQSVANTAPDQRIAHPDNPMNGTHRIIHPKGIQLNTTAVGGTGSDIRFCTNAFAQEVRVLSDGESCTSGEIEQLVSRSSRGWGMNGSDVNSYTDSDGNLRGAGYLNEWVRDYSSETSVRYPN